MPTCNRCGMVAFEVSRQFAENEVKNFNLYFDTLSNEDKELFGNKPSDIKQYEYCWCGEPHTNFRDTQPGDCPDGCTLSSIIKRNE